MKESPIPALADHARSLMGARTRGSTTVCGLEDIDDQELTVPKLAPEVVRPGVKYYFGIEPKLGGRIGTVSLDDYAATAMTLNGVHVRKGRHGFELFIDEPMRPDTLRPTIGFTVIIGPDPELSPEVDIVHTWHPGMPMAPCMITDATGVKLHNG